MKQSIYVLVAIVVSPFAVCGADKPESEAQTAILKELSEGSGVFQEAKDRYEIWVESVKKGVLIRPVIIINGDKGDRTVIRAQTARLAVPPEGKVLQIEVAIAQIYKKGSVVDEDLKTYELPMPAPNKKGKESKPYAASGADVPEREALIEFLNHLAVDKVYRDAKNRYEIWAAGHRDGLVLPVIIINDSKGARMIIRAQKATLKVPPGGKSLTLWMENVRFYMKGGTRIWELETAWELPLSIPNQKEKESKPKDK